MTRLYTTASAILLTILGMQSQTFAPDIDIDLTDKSSAYTFFAYPQCLIDANNDLVKWTWLAGEGFTYENSDINPADDWIVSCPIEFDNGAYTISITARCSHSQYPERFEVKLGAHIDASTLTTPLIAPTTVNHQQSQIYSATFTSSQKQALRLGIHAISDTDMARLSVSRIGVTAATLAPYINADDQPRLLIRGNLLTVPEGTARVYTIEGRHVLTLSGHAQHALTLPHGLYIVRNATHVLKIAL